MKYAAKAFKSFRVTSTIKMGKKDCQQDVIYQQIPLKKWFLFQTIIKLTLVRAQFLSVK